MRALTMLLAAALPPLALWAAPTPSAYQFVAASFLGGTGDTDAVVGCAIQADGSIVLAANPVGADLKRRLACTRLQGTAGFAHCVDVRRVDGRITVVYAGSGATTGMFVKDAPQGAPVSEEALFAILQGPTDVSPEK
jgi:hypothetical protein